MTTTVRSKRKPSAEPSECQDWQHGHAVNYLIVKARSLAAEAERVAERCRCTGPVEGEVVQDIRRRALLLTEEVQSFLDELETARGDADHLMISSALQAVTINAYATCRRIVQRYGRDLRWKN